MEELLKKLEELSGTKIYLKYHNVFEYGIRPEGDVEEISGGVLLSVFPQEKFENISFVVYSYIRQVQKVDSYKEEVYKKSQSMYSFVEIAKLSALNLSRKELFTIFLKLVRDILSFDAGYVFSFENGEIIKNEEKLEVPEESISEFIYENRESTDIFYSILGEGQIFFVGYNLQEIGTVVFAYKQTVFKFEEIEMLIKILAEEIKLVIDIGDYKINIEKLYFNILKRIAEIVNKRNYVYGSNYNIETYMKVSELVGIEYGFSAEELVRLNIALTLKDIGTIIIPENLLHKVGTLTQSEYNIIKKHPVFSSNMLEKTEYFEEFSNVIKHHHEKWDGSGYPDKLSGKAIPTASRIIHVVDVFLALIDGRVYRKKKFDYDEALNVLKENSGTHFDPEIVDIFVNKIEQIKEILKELTV